jgi:hypothetical protein
LTLGRGALKPVANLRGPDCGLDRRHANESAMRKHLKFAAGVGVVLAVIFLIAALVEPFVGELKMQTILIPVIF